MREHGEHSDQPAHQRRNLNNNFYFTVLKEFVDADREDSEQTARKRRLIRVVAVCIYDPTVFHGSIEECLTDQTAKKCTLRH